MNQDIPKLVATSAKPESEKRKQTNSLFPLASSADYLLTDQRESEKV